MQQNKCSIIDIGFSRPRFTWTNRKDLHGLIQERIDRFFVNPSWCLLYSEAKVVHLTRCHSNHCPVLLEMQLGGGGGEIDLFSSKHVGCLTLPFLPLCHDLKVNL